MVRIRFADDRELHIPVKFKIYSTPENWVSVYQSFPADGVPGEELTVVHTGKQTNEYSLTRSTGPNAPAVPSRLSGDGVMIPFARSDFWVADLGLDFLHWPGQRVLRREMRHGQPCAVLESINPHPAPGGYARVVSWVDTDNGGILHADAYDPAGQLIKEFDPTGLKKVDGRRQLEEMEMRNRKTGSHTWIKFDLAPTG
jgi:YD repeat-containing protein